MPRIRHRESDEQLATSAPHIQESPLSTRSLNQQLMDPALEISPGLAKTVSSQREDHSYVEERH
jgi:hypothetical protein